MIGHINSDYIMNLENGSYNGLDPNGKWVQAHYKSKYFNLEGKWCDKVHSV